MNRFRNLCRDMYVAYTRKDEDAKKTFRVLLASTKESRARYHAETGTTVRPGSGPSDTADELVKKLAAKAVEKEEAKLQETKAERIAAKKARRIRRRRRPAN